ncbi:hypothetical protein V5O48_014251, partial [Marasmius crinis-equi]
RGGDVLPFESGIRRMTHNLISDGDFKPGFTKDDVRTIAKILGLQFPSLGLGNVGAKYLEGPEGRRAWEGAGQYYGLSCRAVLGYFHDQLKKATEGTMA